MGATAGGIGRHVGSLLPELVGRGAAVEVWGPASTRRFILPEVRFEPIKIPSQIWKVRAASKGWDLVHVHGMRAGAAVGGIMRGRSGPPVLTTIHNAILGSGTASRLKSRIVNGLVLHWSDRVVYVSSDLLRSAPVRFRHKATVIPATSEVRRTPAASKAALEGAHRVLGVGRLHRQKGFDLLIKAAASMELEGLRVYVAGDGPERKALRELISGLDAEDKVILLGDREDVLDLMVSSDVFCMPSRWEGSPLALHEAMTAGKPIVAARVGGIPDMLGEDCAVLIPAEDPRALADALTRVLTNPRLAQRLGDKARQRSSDWPDATVTAKRIADLYESMLGRPLGGTG